MFVWATVVYFELYEPPGGRLRDLRRGQAVDVVPAASRGASARSTSCTSRWARPVKLTMTSQDVIHSFFVPAFRIKQDVLPGRYTSLWFQPTKVGQVPPVLRRVLRHEPFGDDRLGRVMEPADYERWLRGGGSGPSMAEEGERLFVSTTAAAATARSQTVRAPVLEGVYGHPVPIQQGDDVRFVTADDRYIRDSILLPKSQVVAGYEPVMPSYQGQISEDDLLKIIAYIKSLGNEGGRADERAPTGSSSSDETI